MKVKYKGAQRFTKKDRVTGLESIYCKVHYSADGSKSNSFKDDEGNECHFEYIGEKIASFDATPDSMPHFNGIKPDEFIELDIQPNPSNPQKNICVGIKKSA